MTGPQFTRLKDILREIEAAPMHPSADVRDAYALLDRDDIRHAVNIIHKALDEDDGYVAHKAVEAWHAAGFPEVVRALKAFKTV